jgi:hypothetical protein
MREALIKVLSEIDRTYNNETYSDSWYGETAHQILTLFKHEGCMFPDDPLPDLQVTRECPDCDPANKKKWEGCWNNKQGCTCKDGKLTSPLTVGELVQMARGMVKRLKVLPNGTAFLTLPDGGVVRIRKEE